MSPFDYAVLNNFYWNQRAYSFVHQRKLRCHSWCSLWYSLFKFVRVTAS